MTSKKENEDIVTVLINIASADPGSMKGFGIDPMEAEDLVRAGTSDGDLSYEFNFDDLDPYKQEEVQDILDVVVDRNEIWQKLDAPKDLQGLVKRLKNWLKHDVSGAEVPDLESKIPSMKEVFKR